VHAGPFGARAGHRGRRREGRRPSAPEQESIWGLIPRLASIPFSHQAARDADQGRPVMVTGAVPEQVAAYQLIAEQLSKRFTNS
jgi:hypothetical protein